MTTAVNAKTSLKNWARSCCYRSTTKSGRCIGDEDPLVLRVSDVSFLSPPVLNGNQLCALAPPYNHRAFGGWTLLLFLQFLWFYLEWAVSSICSHSAILHHCVNQAYIHQELKIAISVVQAGLQDSTSHVVNLPYFLAKVATVEVLTLWNLNALFESAPRTSTEALCSQLSGLLLSCSDLLWAPASLSNFSCSSLLESLLVLPFSPSLHPLDSSSF